MMTHRVVQRAEAPYEDTGAATFGPQPNSCKQYANLYFSRLASLMPQAKEAARAQWGGSLQWVKTLDADPGKAVVAGTVYKEMSGKPNPLKEEGRDVLRQNAPAEAERAPKYCGDDDELYLEDDSGRIRLAGSALEKANLVTGLVIAVRGELDINGVLEVHDICLPGLPPQRALEAAEEGADRYVALVSGLQVGEASRERLSLTMLSEYLTGQLGGFDAHKKQASIVRLIIAGNAMSGAPASVGGEGADMLRKAGNAERSSFAASAAALDGFLTSVCSALHVDLMPGPNDPCNFLLPQQPLHRCMLGHSSRLDTLKLCTNPHACEIDGAAFLGTSGQPIDDMQRYLPADGAADRLDTLCNSLLCRHVAPTAPDTLGCYPYTDTDPFEVRSCPHVYFAGNQPAFETRLLEGAAGQKSRVILVPDFAKDPTCVLVNTRTLACETVRLGGA